MPDSPLPDPPIDIAILIKDAQAARVATQIQVVLSRFKSHVNPSSNRKEEQMHKGFFADCEGPIRGLRLPLNAWNVLQREALRRSPGSPLLRTGSSGSRASGQRPPWRSESSLVVLPFLKLSLPDLFQPCRTVSFAECSLGLCW
jgi:hypothetical protein